jgi:hypothetical protein
MTMSWRTPQLLLFGALLPSLAFAWHADRIVFPFAAALPQRRITPGAINPAVTQANIHATICRPRWTRTVRPPEEYTERLKHLQIREYRYRDRRLRDYEEDHLIPLELGGAPASPHNLWPEPHFVEGGWGSFRKDRLENRLRRLVCHGRLRLATARQRIATDWIAAYRRYHRRSPRRCNPARRNPRDAGR